MKLSKYMPKCPNCGRLFLPDANSINLIVSIFPVIQKDYLFCSQRCFDQKTEYVRTHPLNDGLFNKATISAFYRLVGTTNVWRMELVTEEIRAELL